MRNLIIGMIGLDTSHAIAFAKILNNPGEKHHVANGQVKTAYPGGSSDLPLSRERVKDYTAQLQTEYQVRILESIEKVAEASDAILLESVDGRVHLEQLRKVVSFKKPIFIDKPFSLCSKDAEEMIHLSEFYQTSIMSSSALRFSENLQDTLAIDDKGGIIGADCYGPIEFLEKQQGYFWYGIHEVEMLYTIMGPGVSSVKTISNEHHDLLIGKWKDKRIGTVRGNRKGNYQFGAVIHFEKGSVAVDASNNKKPFYASLLEEVIGFFNDQVTRVPLTETLEIIRFIEAANESRMKNKEVTLTSIV